AVLGVTYVVLGRFATLWGVGLLVAQKAVDGLYSPVTKELLNQEIDDRGRRATVLGVESMVRRIAFGLFAPACGLLFDRHGRAAPFYLCGVVGLVGGMLLAARRSRAAAAARLTSQPAGGRVIGSS